jgi:hypothetical protein
MVVREILDELTGLERSFAQALKLLTLLGTDKEIQRILESGLRRAGKTKARIRACCRPLPVPACHQPKTCLRKVA